MPIFIEEVRQKLEPLVQTVVEKSGMDLIELKISGHKNDLFIQITADKPNGGISIGECATLNKLVVAAIEQENVLPPENFSLELSSPGLDRPLISEKDFLRVVGLEVHLWLEDPHRGKKEIEGLLNGVKESSLMIAVPGKETLVLPLTDIVQGMLVL